MFAVVVVVAVYPYSQTRCKSTQSDIDTAHSSESILFSSSGQQSLRQIVTCDILQHDRTMKANMRFYKLCWLSCPAKTFDECGKQDDRSDLLTRLRVEIMQSQKHSECLPSLSWGQSLPHFASNIHLLIIFIFQNQIRRVRGAKRRHRQHNNNGHHKMPQRWSRRRRRREKLQNHWAH